MNRYEINSFRSPELASARTASSLNLLLGIWLIISPFVLPYSLNHAALWDTIAVGILVLCFAAARGMNPVRWIGLSWLNVLLGIWLIISPFVLGYWSVWPALWNNIACGIFLGLVSLWSGAATPVGRQVLR
ncbi:MAG TPA: SPW repeat protein [Gemmataceae bacterium]|nr:SPW repeat protein [Gemmataceae bacterium]